MKKFATKLFIFLVLAILLQTAIAAVWPPRVPKEIEGLNQALERKTDIIFLGDSTVWWCGPKDRTTDSIAAILQRKRPSLSVHETSHGGYHLGVYEHYCRWIAASAHCPRLVIMPINLRTFSPYWEIPGWQFEKVRDTLAHWDNPVFRTFYMPLSIMKFSKSETTEEDYRALPVYDGLRRVGTVSEYKNPEKGKWTEKQIENAFLFFYLGQITEQNRKVQNLRQVIRILKEADIPMLFYFVPTDVLSGVEYHGERFRAQVEQNVRFLEDIIRKEGTVSFDYSDSLGKEMFVWRLTGDCVDEHLNEDGREFVAAKLANEVSNLLKNK